VFKTVQYYWNAARGYRFNPWQSPYIRWRIETYSGWHADQITFARFWQFAWNERRNLMRFLDWAERMQIR